MNEHALTVFLSTVPDASIPDGLRTMYRPTCACGWRARWRSATERTARLDYERHARDHRTESP